jgi:tRNA dimethylallyltransferase
MMEKSFLLPPGRFLPIRYNIELVNSKSKIPVLVIFAPTATGKTALSVDLFGKRSLFFKNRAEIISADSMSVYRYCSIATAKPTDQERLLVPCHLVDIRNPDEQYTTSDFVKDADVVCSDIFSRGKLPVVIGGTGFYLKNFIYGLPETGETDKLIRDFLDGRMLHEGCDALYFQLRAVDPESAAKINSNDSYRIQRALEVYYTTGMPRSSFPVPHILRSRYQFTILILERSLSDLYNRINMRVDRMFDSGLVAEYKSLRLAGYAVSEPRSPALQAIGYRELEVAESNGYSDSALTFAAEQIKANSKQYARKQRNFMNNIPGAIVLPADNQDEIVRIVSLLLDEIRAFGNNSNTF